MNRAFRARPAVWTQPRPPARLPHRRDGRDSRLAAVERQLSAEVLVPVTLVEWSSCDIRFPAHQLRVSVQLADRLVETTFPCAAEGLAIQDLRRFAAWAQVPASAEQDRSPPVLVVFAAASL